MHVARKLSHQPIGQRPEKSILTEMVVEYGPTELFARLFLRAETETRERGVSLGFAPFEALMAVNELNRDNWSKLLTIFDPACSSLSRHNSFCILGWSESGEVVTANAARVFEWRSTSVVDELRSLRLFYETPETMRQSGERLEMQAAPAASVRGTVAYVGAAWVAPSHRKCGLSGVLPRLAKAYAVTRWNADWVTSLMNKTNELQGLAQKFGYPHADQSLVWHNSPMGTVERTLLWMSSTELAHDIESFLGSATQVDGRIKDRQAEQSATAV